jgi:cytochrome b involved in lipid metabolism
MADITSEYISDAIINNEKCIIVINNGVYDITKYLRLHPGGEEILINLNGQNATTEFNDIGHSSSAKKMLEKFKIGSISDEENTKLKGDKGDKDDKKVVRESYVPKVAIMCLTCVLSTIGFISMWMVK